MSVSLAPPDDVDRGAEVARLLEGAARLARDEGTVLLVLVDEAQNIVVDALGELFCAIQEVQGIVVESRDPQSGALRRDSLLLGVVVAGLPGMVDLLRRAGSTFGERSRIVRPGALSPADLHEGMRALVREGGADIDADAQRLRELGNRQREYLHAAAELPVARRTSADIAESLGTTSSMLGSTQQALVDRHGLLRPTGDGRLAFELPGLDHHLDRRG